MLGQKTTTTTAASHRIRSYYQNWLMDAKMNKI